MHLGRLDEIWIKDDDLVVLLDNLLDNSVEACQKLDEKERLINFKFIQEEDKITIAIRNPVNEQLKIEEDQIATTKEKKHEHGIGMTNIKRVIKKYGGDGVCSCNDGYFYYTVIFRKGC